MNTSVIRVWDNLLDLSIQLLLKLLPEDFFNLKDDNSDSDKIL